MLLITGPRQSGRTTKICELLSENALRKSSSALLIVSDYRMCDWTDKNIIIPNLWMNVITKPWSAVHQIRGVNYSFIGIDDASSGVYSLAQHIGREIFAQVVETPTKELKVVRI